MASGPTQDPPRLPGAGKTFFGHPRGLATLFLTEMWERFSFYGMRALLPLYLVSGGPSASHGAQNGGLGLNGATATAVYSVYLALVYLLAMPGGWFGDRVWGPRKAVTIAASVVVAGHLTLAVPGEGAFFAGLTLVAAGSGLLKANISTMVGQLYRGPDDPRRDGGFTVFYMGINLGAFAAPLAIGTVGQQVGWHVGFALAAVGMALGLAQFLLGSRRLDPRSTGVPRPLTRRERATVLRTSGLWVAAAVGFYGVLVAAGRYTLTWALVPITLAGLLIPVLVLARMKRDPELTSTEQSKLSGYLWFFVTAALFWMIYDQGGSTLALFADGRTDTSVFGFDFPASWFQSVNPVLIMAIAPVLAWLWPFLARRAKEPDTAVKFGAGLGLVGLSFFLFVLPLTMTSGGGRVGPMWLVGIYLLQTVGELCVSPVGLSVTTKMAPAKYASQLMGVWFLATTAGDCVTGLLSLSGTRLGGPTAVAAQATLAAVAAAGIYASRSRVRTLMGETA